MPGVPRGKGRVMGNPWGSLDASSQEARLVGSQKIGLYGFGFWKVTDKVFGLSYFSVPQKSTFQLPWLALSVYSLIPPSLALNYLCSASSLTLIFFTFDLLITFC